MADRLVLWDIDGTLLQGGTLGREVFDSAIGVVLGARPEGQVSFSGKTDRRIVEELLALEGVVDTDRISEVLYHLERELGSRVERIASEGSVCPGSEAALRALSEIDSVEQTVLTGNIAPNALVKLAAFGLDRYLDLEVGAYGDKHSDRRHLLPIAWQRQRQLRGAHYRPDNTWIVGDTPMDFECALAGDAHCLLVATGDHDFAELKALGADVVLRDLSVTGSVLEVLASG
jgi:phosphoglycolate phosphatase